MPTYSLTWLPKVLRDAGLNVIEQPGWKSRGRAEMGKVVGVLCHHTAGARSGNAPSLAIVTKGRADLPGPLAQLVLGRDGTFYVVAAGRCNHAGAGDWPGVGRNGGNARLIGIEAENTGLANDNPWPAEQLYAYQRGAAAILKHIGAGPAMCLGHLEYAPGRKSDPSFSVGNRDARLRAMEAFRRRVAAEMADMKRPPARLFDETSGGADGPGDTEVDDADVASDPVDYAPADAQYAQADRDRVAGVQRRLRELGYFGVGKIDGDLAALTRGAIVAFKHDNGLQPETPDIDQAFLAALTTAQPRVVPDTRANATAGDVAATVPTVKETWWSRLWAKILAIPAMGGAAIGWLEKNVDAVREKLDPITSVLGAIPTWTWLALAGGIALVIWRSQRHAEQSAIDLYREGKIL